MDPATFVPGWAYDPAEIDKTREWFRSQGRSPFLADGRPDLKNYHQQFQRTAICESELKLFGQWLPSWSQQRGTCVSQGNGRAAQFAIFAALVGGRMAGGPRQVCPEWIYAGSRVNIGGGQLGGGDGSIGSWAAQYLHKYGIHPRGVYGSYDLSQPNEMVGVRLGNPGGGVPREVLDDPRHRTGIECWECQSLEECWDSIAAECPIAICCNDLYSGQRDSNGCCRMSGNGGHCTALVDFVVDRQNRIITVHQQSWGNGAYSGPDEIPCADGSVYKLGPGRCGIYADDLRRSIRGGGAELWGLSAADPWAEDVDPGKVM